MFDFLKNSSDDDLEKEFVKQLTISNWLRLLESQYSHADSFLSINEIQEMYEIIYNELNEDTFLNKLEDKD